MPTVLVIGTLDTKGLESAYLAQRIRDLGCETLVLDSGILGEADCITADISRQEIAAAGGHTIEELRQAGSRGKAVEGMVKGVRATAERLFIEGRIHAVVSLGGAEGAVLATAAMQALPIGFPKLLVSPIASGKRHFGPFVGTKDIFVLHSVVDILGINSISRPIFDNAAAAVSSMARDYERRAAQPTAEKLRTQIAATMLGNTTRPLMWLKEHLEPRGCDLLLFHANGVGGPAMEELIRAGKIQGVIDYTLSELPGHLVGGFHDGGAGRLEAAGEMGLPQIIVPGCIDFLVFGPSPDIPAPFTERPAYYHNPEFTLVRLTQDEQGKVAHSLAQKLNAAMGEVVVLVPTEGLSISNHPGGEFWDPQADAAFRAELRNNLYPGITYREVAAHINDEAFASVVLETALKLFDFTEN